MRFLRQCFKEFHQTATSPGRSSWYAICSARVAFELVQHRCRITLVFPSGQNDIMPIFRVQGSGSRIDCKKSHLDGWTSLRRDDSTSIQERKCRTLVDCLARSDQKKIGMNTRIHKQAQDETGAKIAVICLDQMLNSNVRVEYVGELE